MFGNKPSHSSSKFLNGLAEQAKGRTAWMYAFLCLLVYQFFVISKLEDAISNGEKILVPYSVATATSEIGFSADYSEGTNYLMLIAEADALLWGNSRPDNAVAQKEKFLRRFHPKLYRVAKEEIIKDAQTDTLREVTRSFVPEKTYIDKEGRIRVDGLTQVDIAGIDSPPMEESLIISYSKGSNGYPYIIGWEKVETREFNQ